MKALVTGSSGFIGSKLCKKLFNNGYEVLGLDPNENFIQDKNFHFFFRRFMTYSKIVWLNLLIKISMCCWRNKIRTSRLLA